MASFPGSSDEPRVPSELSFTRADQELILGSRDFTPEIWIRIQALFEKLVESEDPPSILALESNREVADEAGRLFRNHQRASDERFLDEPITLVRNLAATQPPRFLPGQRLATRFAVERLLGAGGMGEVYLAHDQLLNEWVAIKTIRTHLASDPGIQDRFFAEIQNARRVTHPNVCRIFDLFEEGGTLFFSMEYLNGIRLTEWIRHNRTSTAARRVALELAEGLDAAHRNGILHCDFKPANVLLGGDESNPRPVITDFGLARALSSAGTPNLHSLQAGTLEYMAPELLNGSPANVRTDIYAFGKVLAALLPGHRLAMACISPRPEDRPATLAPVIRALGRGTTRRNWLIAAGAAPFAGLAAYQFLERPRFALLSRQRLAFNGFRPAENSNATLFRDLLITAIHQSLLVTVVPDGRVRATLGNLRFPASLPADRGQLLAAAAQDGITLVLEGTVREIKDGFRCLVQIFQPGSDRPELEVSEAAAAGQLVHLAERVALQLRRDFGESSAALKFGYASLDRVTSAFPDAVEYYFRGVGLYENGEAEAATAWFDRAVRVDPEFAMAHLYRGLSLAARFQVLTAISSYERAFQLRGRVSERERLWIEARYHNITADYLNSLEECRRLISLYPEEATFLRNTAFAYAATGRAQDALPYNRRAAELEPTDNNLSELIGNHTEANLWDDGLAAFDRFRAAGYRTTLLDWGAGLAWMGKGKFDDARAAFVRMGSDAKRDRWARVLNCAPDILQGRFSEAASTLESDLAWDIATKEQNHSLTRRSWLGTLEWLMDAPARALLQARVLSELEPSPAVLQPIREGGLLALSLGDSNLAGQALEALRSIERRWPSTHTRGARAHLEGALLDGEGGTRLLREAAGLWPDPLVLLTQAQSLARQHDFAAALLVCDVLDRQRGRIFKRYFPGLAVLNSIERARALTRLSRFAEALRVYEQIAGLWLGNSREFRLTRELRGEYMQLKNSKQGE